MRGAKYDTNFLRVLTACDVATISCAGRTWVSLGDGVGPPKCVDLYTSISWLLYPIFILFSDSQSHDAWGGGLRHRVRSCRSPAGPAQRLWTVLLRARRL